ncbi:MAG TPA: UbiD family decarboxylase [Candidatus Udaeobacter sp.]|nr:UbiD family decarboxylase [Candidatus Udaeobacter sp.]
MGTSTFIAYKDLREYIVAAERLGELRVVNGADWDLEIGAITEVAARAANPKVVLFDDIKGYPQGFRVIVNAVCSAATTGLAFGLDPSLSGMDMIKAWKQKLGSYKPVKPLEVSRGPVTENVESGSGIDMLKFPTPRWHEHDGGRYIGTGCLVILQDPEEKWTNFGTYRVCVYDKDTLGIWISPGKHGRLIREKYWSKGKPCPVAISFGQDPVLAKVGSWYEPWGVSEIEIAGWLRNGPVQVVRGSETGLPIPATSELAIEGFMLPPEVESRSEGPFGEWTGYYASGTRHEPVVKVKTVMYRNDPIIFGMPPGISGKSVPLSAANVWLALENAGVTDVQGVWEYTTRYITVISIRQKYGGHAKRTAMAMLGSTYGYHRRFVIIVDDDVDPSNIDDVLWALATRCDPATAINVITEAWSTPLDPRITPDARAARNFTNSVAVINACQPYHWKDQYAKTCYFPEETRKKTYEKWKGVLRLE